MSEPSRVTCDDSPRPDERPRGGVHSIGEVLAEWLDRSPIGVWVMKEPMTPG